MYERESYLLSVQSENGANWPHLIAAKARAEAKRKDLRDALLGKDSSEVSVVVFGSLARDEFTKGSDIDWTLLIDGVADAQHLNLTQEIDQIVKRHSDKKVGQEGTFGSMAFSHRLVHLIGGEDDTNRNTTQRILMLLESSAIGRREAYDRVRKHILDRYILEDSRFTATDAEYRVPRFLLNDFARYWRTMAVDFAYKRRTRYQEGSAIRNIKLRMSRKLIYVSGLLACFACHLECSKEERDELFKGPDATRRAVDFFRNSLDRTPLEILCSVLGRHAHLADVADQVLGAYDAFLGELADEDSRKRLEGLLPGQQEDDPIYQRLRRLSHQFRDGLLDLFFDDASGLLELTKVYGVF